jgi:hypothetical protein
VNLTEVKLSGPVFSGKAVELSDKAAEAIEEAVGKAASDRARAILQSNIKVNVTGQEPSSFHVVKDSFGVTVTDSHSVAYGPWLEGTGSKNATSRFKGYHSVRQATSDTDRAAKDIAEVAIAPFIKEMN